MISYLDIRAYLSGSLQKNYCRSNYYNKQFKMKFQAVLSFVFVVLAAFAGLALGLPEPSVSNQPYISNQPYVSNQPSFSNQARMIEPSVSNQPSGIAFTA